MTLPNRSGPGFILRTGGGKLFTGNGTGALPTFTPSVAPTSGAFGSVNPTVTFTPTANWAATPITLSSTVPGSFAGSATTLAVSVGTSTPVSIVFTPSSAAVGQFNGSVSGMTSTGAVTYTATTVVSTFTPSVSPTSGTFGSINPTVTFAPNTTWLASPITLSSTIPGSFAGSATTLAVTVGSTTAASIVFTPGSAATGSFNGAVTGMTSTGAVTYTASLPPAGPITNINFLQYAPLSPIINGYRVAIGKLVAVGGIGPFTATLSSGFVFYAKPLLDVYSDYLNVSANQPLTVTMTDAKGSSFTKTFTVTYAATPNPGIYYGGPSNSTSTILYTTALSANLYQSQQQIQAGGTGHSAGESYAVSDASGRFTSVVYGQLWPAGPVAAGNYSVAVTATGSGTISRTIGITCQASPTPSIEFLPGTTSTSLPVGTIIATACATTVNNSPFWSLTNDAGGKYFINSGTGVVTVNGTLTVGTDIIGIKVDDNGQTITTTFGIAVVAGTIVSSSNMTFPMNAITNYQFNPKVNTRTLGTPAVSSGITGTKRWSLVLPFFPWQVFDAQPGYPYGNMPAFVCDPVTGTVTIQRQLSATTMRGRTMKPGGYSLQMVCTDGINTCIKTFTLNVTEVVGPTYYVGAGMVAAHGTGNHDGVSGFGFNTMRACLNELKASNFGPGCAGCEVIIMPGANTNTYANDNGNDLDPTSPNSGNSIGGTGPITFTGYLGVGGTGPMPRLGGVFGSAKGGYDEGTKGCLVFNYGGDVLVRNLEISHVHIGHFNNGGLPDNGSFAIAGIRLSQGHDGGLNVYNCYIHDCDNNIETGGNNETVTIENTHLGNGSGSTANGQEHGAYIGPHALLVVNNVLSQRTVSGHVFKSRAMKGLFTNTRLFDTERGAGSCQVDICEGGEYTFDNCVFEKGPMPQSPASIQCGAETGSYGSATRQLYPVNVLTVKNSTMINHSPNGGGLFTCIYDFGQKSPVNGVYSTVVSQNNHYAGWGAGPTDPLVYLSNTNDARFRVPTGDTHVFTMSDTGSTYDNVYPALNLTSPCSPVAPARLSWIQSSQDFNGSVSFPYILGVQIDANNDDIRIPVSTTIGTTVFTPTPYGAPTYMQSGATQPDPRINPFTGTNTWQFGLLPYNYIGITYGIDNSFFTINSSTGEIKTAKTMTAGLHLLQIRCTAAASGTIAEFIFYVVAY